MCDTIFNSAHRVVNEPDKRRCIVRTKRYLLHIPKANNMPDLSSLNTPIVPTAMLNVVLGGGRLTKPKATAYYWGFIRIVDKVVYEYQLARESLENAIARDKRMTSYFRCISHLETCVQSLRRAVQYLEGLKRCRVPVDRTTRRLIESCFKEIKNIRDEIEHIDEDIHKEVVPEGEPLALIITDDEKSIQIASHSLSFDRLSTVISSLYTVAQDLSRYRED